MTQEFALWCGTANVAERCEAAECLSTALFDTHSTADERQNSLDALTQLVGDASPKVRLALALRLAREPHAPRRLVRILCDDSDAIAVPLVLASRVLLEEDLVDLAVTGSARLRCAIARRAGVSAAVSAALCFSGERVVALELLANPAAEITPSTLRRIADGPEGADGDVRDLLLRRRTLPADIRQMLMLRTGEQLALMGLARNVLGEAAARRVAAEACEHATATIAEDLSAARMGDFVDHLRLTGQVTPAFLIRAATGGQIDLFAVTLANLSGHHLRRVRAILVEARDPSFSALCTAAGIAAAVTPLLLASVRAWKGIARGDLVAHGDTGAFVLDRLAEMVREGRVPATEELRGLVVRLAAQAARRSAQRTEAPRAEVRRLAA